MNLTIFAGADPRSNLEEMLKLTSLGLGPVCAVVPDSYSVRRMERMLAGMSGDAFLGHRILTFEGLASDILSYTGEAPELIKKYSKHAVLDEIIRIRIGEKSPFHSVSRFPGFINLIVSYLLELRSCGRHAGHTAPELASVSAAYEIYLRKHKITDHEGLVALALERDGIEQFSAQFRGSLIVDGFYDLTERQFDLLAFLFERFRRCSVTLLYDPERPELFTLPERLLGRFEALGAKVRFVDKKLANAPGRVLNGFMGGHYTGMGESGDVQIHTFRDEIAEADWICGTIRKLIAGGYCCTGEIMIVSRNRPGFGSPVHNSLKRHGIPREGGFVRPITNHPLTRLILDAVEAAVYANENLIARVQRSCYTGDLSLPGSFPVESTDDRGWSCMLAESDTPEGFVTGLKNMCEHLIIRENLGGNGMNNPALHDLAVYRRLLELLDEFTALYTPFRKMMRASEFHSLLRQFLSEVNISEITPCGCGVIVAEVDEARHIFRKVVFITGLDNVSFPMKHDTFSLLDSRFAAQVRERREHEEKLLFYLAGIGAERLYLTFPGIDDEGSDASMSPYLEDIRDGISRWREPEFHHGVPGAAWEGGFVSERGRAESLIRFLKRDYAQSPPILAGLRKRNASLSRTLYNALAHMVERINGRELHLREKTSLEHIGSTWGNERVFSVTELERYISCPAAFFLSRVLGLKVDKIEEDEIHAADMGTIVHNILAEFYTRRLNQGERASFKRSELNECRREMKKIAEEAIPGKSIPKRLFHPIVLIAERKLLAAWMNVFLDREVEYFEETGFEPSFFEISFGRAQHSSPSHPPLSLDMEGGKILIGGRIDRIDCTTDGGNQLLRVVDYKTGVGNASFRELKEGTAVQIPLYLKAAAEIIMPDCVLLDGVFYSLRDMEMKGYRANKTPVAGEDWKEFIDTACRSACAAAVGIRKGSFPGGASCADYCDFKTLCFGGRLIKEKSRYADS